MTRSEYKNQRILVCFVAYYFCYIAFKNELYYEFFLEIAITSTSLWYHMTETPFARKVDVITIILTGPTTMILSMSKSNYYPVFFNTLAALGYYFKSIKGTMKDHFLYVHIPALMSQFSSSQRLEQG
jgi:hypothetical protein